jgi:monofunctional biosynthetic peptidoglycan transglycosylase
MAAIALALGAGGYAAGVALAVPPVAPLAAGAPPATRYMHLRAAEGGLPRASAAPAPAVPLEGISVLLVCAVVKAEDRTFFRHGGVLWDQVPALAGDALRGRGARGGSTITQQLARNLYLSPRRTPHRKLREAVIAGRLERGLSKRRLLELYLNVIEWGDGVWGAHAASRHYFQEDPAGVDAFEAAFLASLVAAPRSPLAGTNAERARGVQRRVLGQLRDSGLLTEREMRAAWLQADTLHAALAAGEPLPRALARARRRAAPPPRGLPPLDGVLDGECGLERELGRDPSRGRGAGGRPLTGSGG